ncbi:MAG: EFR1 family ferrodoxin, partial [Clostridiales bacterium]|nr:EFR1 family ferrodoxin [Clostridiales bacterium]
KSAKTLDKADERLRGFAVGIAEGVQAVRTLPLTAKSLYKNIEKLDAGFAAGGGCTGCGLCQKICPVKNIRLENGRPKWLGQCERCVACISWCPSKAIDYGSKTQERRRYRNPRVKAEDLASRGQDE